jgi:surface polysaccharide O-acyltransferase-like enzyme
MAERIDYFDVLRGLAIIAVIAIHASRTGIQSGEDSINFYVAILWKNIWSYAVPLFISISGYFLAKKSFYQWHDYFAFLGKQIPRVYLPMFFWSLVFLSVAMMNSNTTITNELVKLITFQSAGPYYFIALIIQYYLLLPVLKKFANVEGLIISIVISCFTVAVIFYVRYFIGIELPLIIYAGNCLTWVMFFVLGLYLGQGKQIKVSNILLISLILGFYLLSCLEAYLLVQWFHKPTANKLSSFFYAFSLIVYLFKNKDLIRTNVLKELGRLSFGIYLVHMLVLDLESRALHKLIPMFDQDSLIHLVLLSALVVATCAIAIRVANKMLSSKVSVLIGFK